MPHRPRSGSAFVALVAALAFVSSNTAPAHGQQPPLQPVDFAANRVTIRHGDPIGRVNCGLIGPGLDLTFEAGSINEKSREFRNAFLDAASAAGVPTPTSDSSLFAIRGQTHPDYAVGSLISKLIVSGCRYQGERTGRLALDGTVTLTIDWEVFSILEDRVVYRERVLGIYKTKEDVYFSESLLYAYRDGAQKLAHSPKFRQAISQPSTAKAAAVTAPVTGERWLLPGLASFRAPVAQNIDYVRWATVTIEVPGGYGSGFFLTQDGWIMTNAHVARGSQSVKVVLADGRLIYGQVVRMHDARDVALVKVEGNGYAALPLRTQPVVITEEVYAVGAPLDKKFSGTVTRGIVSRFTNNSKHLTDIQADVMIQGGSSGGPLIDSYGNVVGISYAGRGRTNQGINFFIPIQDALDKLNLQLGAQ